MIASSSVGSGASTEAAEACELRLEVVPLPGGPNVVIMVAGEADLSTYQLLRDQLVSVSAGGPTAVLVDVSALTFCDLSGLDALLEAACISHGTGVPMTFRGMSPQLSWMYRTFPHRHAAHRSAVPSAVASCSVPQPTEAATLR